MAFTAPQVSGSGYARGGISPMAAAASALTRNATGPVELERIAPTIRLYRAGLVSGPGVVTDEPGGELGILFAAPGTWEGVVRQDLLGGKCSPFALPVVVAAGEKLWVSRKEIELTDPFDVEGALARARAIPEAHMQLGSHLTPSEQLRAEVEAAAAERGLRVEFEARLGMDAGAANWQTSVVLWWAVARTARGEAREPVQHTASIADAAGMLTAVTSADECWRNAFRALGVLD